MTTTIAAIENSEDLSLLEQAKLFINNKQFYRMNDLFCKSNATLDDIKAICDYVDTELQTREERKFFIAGIQHIYVKKLDKIQLTNYNDNTREFNERMEILRVIAPHTAIVRAMIDNFSFCDEDFKILWMLGAGRKIIRRSQRKFSKYLEMLAHFREWVEDKDLEFGVFMAAKMRRANVTNIMANEYGDKLNTSQIERIDALKMLFYMNAQADMY